MENLKKLIEKYNVPVPRYTSYPPANHFEDDFQEMKVLEMISESNRTETENIAIYIHIPFCKKICFYCGCNAMTSKGDDVTFAYVEALKKELRMVAKLLNKNRKVSQIHYGGGTPNAIDVKYLEELNQLIFDLFDVIPYPEIAIECHPGYLDELYLQRLLNARFNRFSLGIQDFNTDVLKTVNREPAAMPVKEIVDFIRMINPSVSVNLDFIYGLPGQTVESFSKTIKEAVDIAPDRLVTFSYAHVPWLKKHQQILEKKGLLTSDEKLDIFMSSRQLLVEAGYVPIGLDHYVKPKDELNMALESGQLHRNFQGYCTRRTTGQVYAFGVSSISQLDKGFYQNFKNVETYIEKIGSGHLVVEKGFELSVSQLVIKEIIERIMCNKYIDFALIEEKYDLTSEKLDQITQVKATQLQMFEADGLLNRNGKTLEITTQGSFFIRNIAAAFDPAYQEKENQYSKSI